MDAFTRDKPYWSERRERGPLSGGVDLPTIRRLYKSNFDWLWDRGFFQEAFGKWCVDGDIEGELGAKPGEWFLRELGRDVWPFDSSIESWDEDTFFDIVEAMHQLCSEGIAGTDHPYGDCGMHFDTFDRDAGRVEYRRVVNRVLLRFERPMEIDERGDVIEAGPKEMRPLLRATVPGRDAHESAVEKTESAIQLYWNRSSDPHDRRRAVRDLADVLEWLRPTIKEEALPKDEQALFNIANKFAIRHDNREQRRMYDDAIWLSWTFWIYLATIHAALRLAERTDTGESSASP